MHSTRAPTIARDSSRRETSVYRFAGASISVNYSHVDLLRFLLAPVTLCFVGCAVAENPPPRDEPPPNERARSDAAGRDAGRTLDGSMRDAGSNRVLADGGRDGNGAIEPLDASLDGGRVIDYAPSGPVTLSSGSEITGLHITSSDGPCIRGTDVASVRIHHNRIGPCGDGADGVGIAITGAEDVEIDNNAFDDVASGFYLIGASEDIRFHHNRGERIRGPFPRGQLVQFNGVEGAGLIISCNVSDLTTPGYLAGPEDHINLFQSGGTATSPILVEYNRLRGGGPSDSGGGIMVGDYGGHDVEVRGNVTVNPGQYGVAVAGGTAIRIVDNIVYAPDVFDWSNVGLYVWRQSDPPCEGIEVRGNRVWYQAEFGANHNWDGENCGAIAGWADNQFGDSGLDASVWETAIAECE